MRYSIEQTGASFEMGRLKCASKSPCYRLLLHTSWFALCYPGDTITDLSGNEDAAVLHPCSYMLVGF